MGAAELSVGAGATVNAASLLRQAARFYDEHAGAVLPPRPRGGPSGGVRWMQAMLRLMRGLPAESAVSASVGPAVERAVSVECAGQLLLLKYGLALSAGAAAGLLLAGVLRAVSSALGWSSWQLVVVGGALSGFVAGFYALECQLAFLVPLHHDAPQLTVTALLRQSRRLTLRAGGTLHVMSRVMHIAAFMLLGGMLGRGYLRSWCIGCVAICIWYEQLRARCSANKVS